MAEKQMVQEKKDPWDNLRKIKAFSRQPNELLDKQRITEKDSLMYPVYEHALYALKNVMESSKNWVKESTDSRKKDFYGYGNNVIAFCAPRGQGKTSAMLSLSHALEHCDDVVMNEYSYPYNSDEDKNGRKRAARCFVKEWSPLWEATIANKHFLVMPPIDPTVLDGKESVVNLVLAWLFQEINEAWKNCQDSPERIEKEKLELLKHFQKCKECLARHNGTKDADFSDLIKKSVIFEIKEHLYDIINCYFQVCGISKSGIENYLIIQLDDTDMDMVNAYDVLEDVRKFLSLPQTIVLMATYLRQLRMLVAKHYEDVLPLPHGNVDDNKHPIDYMQMAAKYIDKLIPAQQMIHIGSFRNQRDLNGKVPINSFLEHYADESETKKRDSGNNTSGIASDIEDDLEEEFFALIQAKTGLIFKKHGTYVNNILPTSLRGLVHLFQLLERMERPILDDEHIASIDSFDDYYHELKIRQRNLLIFEDYFRNDWCYSNLVEEDQEIMWKISQTHVAPKLRIIRNLLLERWKWTEDWWKSRNRSDFEPVLNKGVVTLAFNTNTKEFEDGSLHYEFKNNTTDSLGPSINFTDMICLLEEAEHRGESMNDLLLNFAIRTHLSILLQKLDLSDKLDSTAKRRQSAVAKRAESDNGVVRWHDHKQLKSFLSCKMPIALNIFTDKAISQLLDVLANEANGFQQKSDKQAFLKGIYDIAPKEGDSLIEKDNILLLLNNEIIEKLESLCDEEIDRLKTESPQNNGSLNKLNALNSLFSKLKDSISREPRDSIIEKRMSMLFALFFDKELLDTKSEEAGSSSPTGKKYTNKEYEQAYYVLQESVFKVLGNHEVLRLWLSDKPERFSRCGSYVWFSDDKHQDSIYAALSNARKKELNDEPAKKNGRKKTRGKQQKKSSPEMKIEIGNMAEKEAEDLELSQ